MPVGISLSISVYSSRLVKLHGGLIARKKITIISGTEDNDKVSLMPVIQTNEVGEILHLAKSGRLIVKLNAEGAKRVKVGELLVDGSGRKVGRVGELLGPVKTPYASVITMTDRTNRLIGSKVFGGGFDKKSHGRSRSFSRSNSR
jgi:RNA-binding protein